MWNYVWTNLTMPGGCRPQPPALSWQDYSKTWFWLINGSPFWRCQGLPPQDPRFFWVNFWTSVFQAPIIASIASESNGCGITSGNALEPEWWPFQIWKFWFSLESFQAPIIASIVRSRLSESNSCGMTFGNALEPELWPFIIWKFSFTLKSFHA